MSVPQPLAVRGSARSRSLNERVLAVTPPALSGEPAVEVELARKRAR